jgi:hypothetical protein
MYSEYFAQFTRQSGVPRLNYAQFNRVLKIVHLEGQIATFDNIRNKAKDQAIITACNRGIYQLEGELKFLTQGMKPNELMKQLVKLSILGDSSEFEVFRPWED